MFHATNIVSVHDIRSLAKPQALLRGEHIEVNRSRAPTSETDVMIAV